MAEREDMTDDDLQAIVSTAVKEAIDFCESEIAPRRLLSQEYYDGACKIGSEEGRSTTVRTVVRDTVRAIKPSLQRIFASTDKAVEFVPKGPEDVQICQLATKAINAIFDRCGSFTLLDDAFTDALVKRNGILKAYYEDSDAQTIHDYTGLDQQAFEFLKSQDDLELLSEAVETSVELGPDGVETGTSLISARFARTKTTGEIKVVSVPSEEFFINRDARSIEDCYVCGHSTEMRVGDLVALGYDFDDIHELTSQPDNDTRDQERTARRGYSSSGEDDDSYGRDQSMKLIQVCEAYMRVDVFNTGIPVLYKFVLGGSGYKLLSAEPCDKIPFAIFEVDKNPHTFWGTSIADILIDDQDAASSILRSILDNAMMTNVPRLAVTESQTNLDDVLNNEIGAVIRTRGNPSAAIQPITVPFTAAQTLSALQYIDQMVETKSGVKADSQLHPDSLQSTTAIGIQAQMQSAQAQIETMARNLAEGGMTQLFKLLLHLFIHNTDREMIMKIDNTFQGVDPRSWEADLDCVVNVGLGTGREDEKRQMLMQIMGVQQSLIQTMGPQNPLTSLSQFRNTLADLMAASGIRNADRYFQPLTPQQEQQMAQQQAQQAQQAQQMAQQNDPTKTMMQIEQMKAQTKSQGDMARLQFEAQKFQADQAVKQQEMAMKDDLERDKLVQDLAVKVANILGQWGQAVDVNQVKREQAAPREMNGYNN